MVEYRFGKAETMDRNHHGAPLWVTSPMAETMRLERIQSGFKSPVTYQFARIAQR